MLPVCAQSRQIVAVVTQLGFGTWHRAFCSFQFSVVHTERSTVVQGNGVCFLPFRKSVWKVNRRKWICTLQISPVFLIGQAGGAGTVRPAAAAQRGSWYSEPTAMEGPCTTGFAVAFIDKTRFLKYFRSLAQSSLFPPDITSFFFFNFLNSLQLHFLPSPGMLCNIHHLLLIWAFVRLNYQLF